MKQGLPLGRVALASLIALTVVIAWLVRYRYFIGFGGAEHNYLDWASEHYFGGITRGYYHTVVAIVTLDWSSSSHLYPPFYPLVLALIQIFFSDDLQLARLIQAGLDALGAVIAYLICCRLGCQRLVGVLAGLGYAIAPWWAWGSTLVLADALVPVMVLLLVFTLIHARDNGRSLDWLIVGLVGCALTLTRSEFGLLVAAIIVLALIGAPGRRVQAITAGMAGFWLPWLGVATVNYFTFGHFFPASNATFYALYSGLGQVENAYGYVVSDEKASYLLAANGLTYHGPGAEEFWRKIYFDAWRNHPGHVIQTILHRFGLIAFGQELTSYPKTFVPLFGWGLGLAAVAAMILAVRKRFYNLLIVLGPLLFALGTLGIIYVELRYVRYASLTYLFSAAIVLSAVVSWAGRAFGRRDRVRRVAGAVAFAVAYLGIWAIGFLPADAEARRIIRDSAPPDFPSAEWSPVANLVPAVDGAQVAARGERLEITSSQTIMGYQAWAEVDTRGAQLLLLDLAVDAPADGRWYAGILSEDTTRFHQQIVFTSGESLKGIYAIDPDGDGLVRLVFTGMTPGRHCTSIACELPKSAVTGPRQSAGYCFLIQPICQLSI